MKEKVYNHKIRTNYVIVLLVYLLILVVFPIKVYADANNGMGDKVIDGGQRDFKWPVPSSSIISSCFLDYMGHNNNSHSAIDIKGDHYAKVIASYDGDVIKVVNTCTDDFPIGNGKSSGSGFGNYIVIQHSYTLLNGTKITLYSRYSHLSSASVSEGDKVTKGQTIGKIGSTGSSYGYHLDFQICYGGWNPYQTYSRDPYVNQFLELPSGFTASGGADTWCTCCYNYVAAVKELYKTPTNSDNISPVISDFKITNLSSSGYTVTCTVTDNVGVTRVRFPTWPDANGEWNPVLHEGVLSGSATNRTATFNVSVMDHYQLTDTKYATQVYAYDAAGNNAFRDTAWVYVPSVRPKVSEGTYHIVSALDEDYGLDIAKGSTDPGTPIQVYKNATDDAQTFDIKYLGNGEYSITSTKSGLNMDVYSAGTTNGTSIIMYNGNNTDAQKWFIRDAGKGYVYLISKCNGLYVDVAGGKIDGGASAQMYTGNDTDAQKWRLVCTEQGEKTVPDGEYHIVSGADESLGLDMKGGSKEDKTSIQLYENAADPVQTFTVEYQGDGTYEIYSPIANKSLDAAGALATSGTNLQIYTRNGTPAQRWRILPTGDGSYYIVNQLNNLAVDIQGNVIQSETNVQLYARNGTIAQKWKFKPVVSEDCGHYSVTDTGANIRTWGGALGIAKGREAGFYFGANENSLKKYKAGSGAYTEDGLDIYINDYAGGLNPGTRYYYQFYSIGADGKENKGQLSSFTTKDALDEVPGSVLSKPDASLEYNGNRYYRFDTCVEHWESAKRACEAMGGHLVTVTSEGEKDIVTNLVNGGAVNEYWAGGTDRSSEGDWEWITSEEWNMDNWYGTQPDNTLGIEDYLTVYRDAPGKWNDSIETYLVKGKPNRGFLCEVEKAETYQITYHLNGGVLKGTNPSSYTSDHNKLTLESPTKEHYVFQGWFDAETDGRQITADTACSGDLDLYAYWMPEKYKLILDPDGGELSGDHEIEGIYGQAYGDLPEPEREGYAFGGWYADGALIDKNTICMGNATALARWTAKKVTVSFDSNGGAAVSPQTVELSYDGTYGSLPVADRDGFVFQGWYLEKEGGEQILETSIVRDARAHTLYAHWQEEEEPAHIHSYEEKITKKATCTEDGLKTFTCSECGDYYTEIIKAGGHRYSEWKVTEKPSCQKEGTEQRICEECGTVEKRTSGKTEHDYKDKVIEPTCTSFGYTEHVCTMCGDSYKDSYRNYADHTIVTDKAREASCTETGLTEGSHCSTCGKVLVVQKVIEKKEHSYDAGVVTEESTCTQQGHKLFICKDCGNTKEELLPFAEHREEVDPAVDPGCEEYGLTEGSHCPVCGETIKAQNIIPALGHDYEGKVTKGASCTEKGEETFTCRRCKQSYSEEIPAKGHTAVTDPAVEPTTTSTGLTEGSHCSVCGEVIKAQEVIPKKTEETEQKEETKPAAPSDPDHPDVEAQERQITTQVGDGDPKGSTYAVLSARVKRSAKTYNTLVWNKVSGANGYIIYGNRCGTKYHFQKLAEVKGTSYKHSGLKKGTYYKYLVVAYKEASGRRTVLATSKTMHAATTGGKVGNCKKLTLNKTKVTLKVKKTFKIKAKEVAASKKMKIRRHRKIAFESSNPMIATVSSTGKIKAIKKGSCKIYVYAQNGVYKVINVKVK